MARSARVQGGNALRYIYGSPRSTLDSDFSADCRFPDDKAAIRGLIDAQLAAAYERFAVKARCGSIERRPPGTDHTRPTYQITIAYSLQGDRGHQNFERTKSPSSVVYLEISIHDVVCEAVDHPLPPGSGTAIHVCSIEDILAEKLRALLQQRRTIRNRHRPQDVFDISFFWRGRRTVLDPAKLGGYLLRKAAARDVEVSKSRFDDEIKTQAAADYDETLQATPGFVPFDDAWADVISLVQMLDIPR